MLKLNASYSKKVPAEVEYSSRSFMACVETELPSGATPEELRHKIHETFALVKQAVEDEINVKATSSSPNTPERSEKRSEASQGPASLKQIRYILDLGKARERPIAELNEKVKELYGSDSIYDLCKKDASKFLDHLKAA